MRAESSIRGYSSILLAFAIVLSMAISMTFTAPPVLATGVVEDPGGTTITVYPMQTFTLQFKMEWDEPEELGYFVFAIYWDSPRDGVLNKGTENENFTFVSVSAYMEDNGDPITPIDVTRGEGVKPGDPNTWRYTLTFAHSAGHTGDGEFFVDIVMLASGYGGAPHIAPDNHNIVISGTIDVQESRYVSYTPPNPYITIRVLPAVWRLIETRIGVVEAPAEWQLVETWTGTVQPPAEWTLVESWSGLAQAPAGWSVIESWTGTIEASAGWDLIEEWIGGIEAPAAWQLAEEWGGNVEAPANWVLIESWSGIIEAPANWELIETWNGIIQAPAEWQLIETWDGAVESPAQWQLIETWTGTVEAPAEWQLIETWTGTIEAPSVWGLIETWTGSLHHYLAQVTTEPATDITQNSATLNASIDYGNFSDVDIRFQYRVQGASVWENTDWTYYTQSSYSDSVSGLSPSTTYKFMGHIRFDSREDFGDILEFTTLTVPSPPPPPPPPPVDNVPPPVPLLISPADGENITDNTPLLDWSDVSVPSGVTYDLFIARDAEFTSVVLQKTDLTASAYELTSAEALAVDTYYWRVRGVDGAGNVGSWSENWSFTYMEIPTELIENESPPIDIPSITTDENATIEVENTAITGMTIVVGENVENVRITVQQLTDKPAEIAIGAPGVTYTYLNIASENITDADIDIVLINFEVEKAWITAENVDPDSIVMLRWDSVAEVWVSLPTTRIGEDDTYYCYQAESPGLSIFGIGYALAPAPAEFEFSNLVIEPSEVRAGKTVTISVVVAHVGDLGSYNVILKIDNVVEATERVTLAGVATETVTFTVSSDAEGTHDIEVEGLAGTFVVTPSAPPPIVPLAITGGIVLLAGILIWLRRRRTPIAGGYPSTNGANARITSYHRIFFFTLFASKKYFRVKK